MLTVSCPRCSAPLSFEAAQGRAPCASCGALTAPPVSPMNPFALQPPVAQGPTGFGAPAPVAQAWGCPACRRENQPHYEFCLGCGARRGSGAEPMAQAYGYQGNLGTARPRSSMWILLLLAAIVVGGAIVGALLVFAQ